MPETTSAHLRVGTIVHYTEHDRFVYPGDLHRAAIVVYVHDEARGLVNLAVFNSGSVDGTGSNEPATTLLTYVEYSQIPHDRSWHRLEDDD